MFMAPELGVVKVNPEPYKAMQAIETAKELLGHAEEILEEGDYETAYGNALNSMRMASSALMFMDGQIAQTLEMATEYIRSKYSRIPVDDWRAAEDKDPLKKGFVQWLLETLGIRKKEDYKAVTAKVVSAAKVFVLSVEQEVQGGKQPGFETFYRYE